MPAKTTSTTTKTKKKRKTITVAFYPCKVMCYKPETQQRILYTHVPHFWGLDWSMSLFSS